jgi:hypothetical protein
MITFSVVLSAMLMAGAGAMMRLGYGALGIE